MIFTISSFLGWTVAAIVPMLSHAECAPVVLFVAFVLILQLHNFGDLRIAYLNFSERTRISRPLSYCGCVRLSEVAFIVRNMR